MSTQPVATQQPQDPKQDSLATMPDETGIGFESAGAFKLLQRVGKMYSECPLVPDTFRGNVASCSIAVSMAHRMGADPLMVMQNLYLVHNRPGWSAKFLIATLNHSGDFSKLRYEWAEAKPYEPGWGCRAYCTEKETGEVLRGPWITWKMVQAEKWESKNGSKWLTIPELMFMYRSGAWFINTHAPEIAMGLRTTEELEDIGPTEINVTQSAEVLERIQEAIDKAPSKLDALVDADKAIKEAPKAPRPPTESKPKQTSAKKEEKPAAASTPLENPNFAEGNDGDPFLDNQ